MERAALRKQRISEGHKHKLGDNTDFEIVPAGACMFLLNVPAGAAAGCQAFNTLLKGNCTAVMLLVFLCGDPPVTSLHL